MAISTCAACRQSFASLSSFDKHRAGSFSQRERRCLSPAEMREVGLIKGDRHWHFADTGIDFSKLRQRLSA